MAIQNTPPKELKIIVDEYFAHEKKMILERIETLTRVKGLKWVEDKTGISKRQLNRIHSQSANITLYTWCILKAAMVQFGPQQNLNYNNKS